jgi:hypothetical protein
MTSFLRSAVAVEFVPQARDGALGVLPLGGRQGDGAEDVRHEGPVKKEEVPSAASPSPASVQQNLEGSQTKLWLRPKAQTESGTSSSSSVPSLAVRFSCVLHRSVSDAVGTSRTMQTALVAFVVHLRPKRSLWWIALAASRLGARRCSVLATHCVSRVCLGWLASWIPPCVHLHRRLPRARTLLQWERPPAPALPLCLRDESAMPLLLLL